MNPVPDYTYIQGLELHLKGNILQTEYNSKSFLKIAQKPAILQLYASSCETSTQL